MEGVNEKIDRVTKICEIFVAQRCPSKERVEE